MVYLSLFKVDVLVSHSSIQNRILYALESRRRDILKEEWIDESEDKGERKMEIENNDKKKGDEKEERWCRITKKIGNNTCYFKLSRTHELMDW